MASKKRKSSKRKSSKKSKRSYRRLTAKEIATIKSMTKQGKTMRQIAKAIRRVPSTVWRWQNQ